jgi:hypothetical protein
MLSTIPRTFEQLAGRDSGGSHFARTPSEKNETAALAMAGAGS